MDEMTTYPFITDSMSNDEYHADDRALSRSQISLALRSPKHFLKHVTDKKVKEPTEALMMGDAYHTMVLEPDEFDNRFIVMPESLSKPSTSQLKAKKPSKETVAKIEKWTAFEKERGDRVALKKEQKEALDSWVEPLLLNREFADMVAYGGRVENSIFYRDAETRIVLKVRPDFLANDGSFIIDLKTALDASPYKMQTSFRTYNYDIQMAMMFEACESLFGKEPQDFIIAAIEKEEAIEAIYRPDSAMLEVGKKKLRHILRKLKHCQETGNWHGYGDGQTIMSLSPAHFELQLMEIDGELV